MVNLTYRNVAGAAAGARDGRRPATIGEVRHVEAGLPAELAGRRRPGATGATEPQWLWRLSTAHGSNGVLGDVGIHILDFASYGAADDIVSLSADLETFPKAEGDRIGDYVLDANDSFAMTGAAEIGRAGDGRRPPATPPATSTICRWRCTAPRAR